MFDLPPVACGSLHAFLIKMSKCCRVGELRGLPGKSCLRKGFRHPSGFLLSCGDRVFVSTDNNPFVSGLAQTFFLSEWTRIVYHNCLRYMAAELPNCR